MERSELKSRRRVGRSRPYRWKVTDRMWSRLAGLLDDPPRNPRYPGRPRYSPRQCLEGILYVLFTGTPWLELPARELGLPSGETCRRRLEEWARRDLLPQVIQALQHELAAAGRLDWSPPLADASLANRSRPAPGPAPSGAGADDEHARPTRKHDTAGRSNAPTPG